MRLAALLLLLTLHLPAQRPQKAEQVDTGLAELETLGALIARTVEARDWATILDYEPAEFRSDHQAALRDAKSDFYCFLVDANCNPDWRGRTSVYHLLALAHSLGVTAIPSGPLPAQAATLFFYDRSEIPVLALRSTQFLCMEGGWKKSLSGRFERPTASGSPSARPLNMRPTQSANEKSRARWRSSAARSFTALGSYPRSKLNTCCGAEFAWAKAAIPAWSRICDLVRLADSAARSASRIRLSAAARFESCDCARLIA